MMGGLLTTASVMMCPHGGTVTAISSNTRVNAGGAPILRSSDTFVIAGCPFVLGVVPHPCVTVQWLTTDLRSQVLSDSTLSEASVGMCLAPDQAPQGTVIVMTTQESVSGE
jgi:hypothetical protein